MCRCDVNTCADTMCREVQAMPAPLNTRRLRSRHTPPRRVKPDLQFDHARRTWIFLVYAVEHILVPAIRVAHITFNLAHEAMHLGTIIALAKVV